MFEAFVHKLFWPYLLGGLVALMSISNPLSKIPLFVSLTEDMTDGYLHCDLADVPLGARHFAGQGLPLQTSGLWSCRLR